MMEFLKTLGAPKDTPSKGRKKKKRYTRFKSRTRATKVDENAQHTRFQNARPRDHADIECPNVAEPAPDATQTTTPQTTTPQATMPHGSADAIPKRDAPKPVAEPVAAPIAEPGVAPASDPIVEPIAEPSADGVKTPTAAEAFFHPEPSPKRANVAASTNQSVSPDVLRRALPKRFSDLDPDHPVG